ncbi:MAG: TatD family hydrolase [Deltaproteobacteria bacterium]|nr:TatD family hydrolase [Deltaproteobacteria bacterium]
MIDSHCHLTWPEFDADRDAVIARARAAGVTAMVTIGAGQGLEGNAKAIALAEQNPNIYAAVGIHPHDADQFSEDALACLKRLARHPKVVAIGEIGLDYHYHKDTRVRQKQLETFQALCDLAARLALPIVIHQRDAEQDLLRILSHTPLLTKEGPGEIQKPRGIHHCFGGSVAFAREMIARGFLLGIGGVVTFKNAQALRDVVRAVPLEHLVLETDAPYLAPVPFRGKRNEPSYLTHTVAQLIQLTDRMPAEIAAITTSNVRRTFRITN